MLSEKEKKVIERVEHTFYENKEKGTNNLQKITLYKDGILDILKLLNIVEKVQRENDLLNEYVKENEIYKKNLFDYGEKKDKQIKLIVNEVKTNLAFENRLKRENEEPDLFNQGKFYICNIINNILKN